MIEDFKKVWNKHSMGEWDEYQNILEKLDIHDNPYMKHQLYLWAKSIYSFGFSDGHYDASHDYYEYRKKINDVVKDINKLTIDLLFIERDCDNPKDK